MRLFTLLATALTLTALITIVEAEPLHFHLPKFLKKKSESSTDDRPIGLIRKKSTTKVSLNDNYVKGKLLGQGGFGTVWETYKRDDPSKNPLALKCLRPDQAETHSASQVEEEFKREYDFQKAAQSPYVLNAFELTKMDGQTCVVMEIAKGGDIEDYFVKKLNLEGEKVKRVPEPSAKPAFYQWALAVKALHDNKIAHRDIKPGNVLMTADGKVKLSDFGLSCYLDDRDSVEERRRAVGTGGYKAPEIVIYVRERDGRKRNIVPKYQNKDPRKLDVYALGVAFRRLVTGESKSNFAPVIPGVSAQFASLITGMMMENPDKRYSIDQVVQDPWFSGVQV